MSTDSASRLEKLRASLTKWRDEVNQRQAERAARQPQARPSEELKPVPPDEGVVTTSVTFGVKPKRKDQTQA